MESYKIRFPSFHPPQDSNPNPFNTGGLGTRCDYYEVLGLEKSATSTAAWVLLVGVVVRDPLRVGCGTCSMVLFLNQKVLHSGNLI